MSITTPKKFVEKFKTKTKINNEIVENDIEVSNKFSGFIKNDIAELYIDCVDGDDSNDGFSTVNALKTIDKALDLVRQYGWCSSHLYLMTAGDYIALNYKNIGSVSIHFHSRAENISLIFRNESTAFKPAYDYNAFYGCHYNFGTTEKDTDGFNFIHRMKVIFQEPDYYIYKGKQIKTNNPYFENCSTVFNGCDIYVQDLNGNNRENGCVGFSGGNVLLDQTRACCMILFSYTQAVIRDSCTILLADTMCALRCTHARVMYYNHLQNVGGQIVPRWKYLYDPTQTPVVNFGNVYRINTNQHKISEALFTLTNSELSFPQNSSYLIQNYHVSVTNLINRIVNSLGSTIIGIDDVITDLNKYNPSGSGNFVADNDNIARLTTANGHFNKTTSGGTIVGS